MDSRKRQRLERAGWRVGTVREFLALSDADVAYIEMKLGLAALLARLRLARRYTQLDAAKLLGSSQSRIAKMESGDASVSLDLMIRSLLALGAKPREVAKAMSGASGRDRKSVRSRPTRRKHQNARA